MGVLLVGCIPIYNTVLIEPVGSCGDPDGYHEIEVSGEVEQRQSNWEFDGRVDISDSFAAPPTAENIEVTFLNSQGDPIKRTHVDSLSLESNHSFVSMFTTELPQRPASIELKADLSEMPKKGWVATYSLSFPSENVMGTIWYRPNGNCFDVPG